MRCPKEWVYAKKKARADAIMMTLGMSHVADSYVYAVSGGQRKRASAAIEFMSGRPLLFMDEPTSGLDSATAKALVERLSRAAHDEARTVIATIHQPSWDLLVSSNRTQRPSSPFLSQNKFDRIVLLANRGDLGGTVVFDAPPSEIPSHFASGGSAVPEGENPADHLMYVLKDDGGEKWAEIWEASPARKEQSEVPTELVEDGDGDGDAYPISFWDQCRALFIRSLHIWVADPQQGQLMLKMIVGINVILVLLVAGMPLNLSKANVMFYLVIVQFAMSMTPLVIIMPEERAVILREYRNGVFSANAYWLARFMLAMCHACVVATFATVFTYPLMGLPMTPFPSKLLRWWCFEFLYISCIMMLGLTVGIFSQTALSGIKVVVAIQLPWIVTCGVLPPLHLVRPALFPLHYPNLFTWAAKLALTIGFTHNGEKAIHVVRDELGYHVGNANSCYQALAIAFGILFFAGLAAVQIVLNRGDLSAGQRKPPPKPKGDIDKTKTVKEAEHLLTDPLLSAVEPERASSYGAVDVEAPNMTRSVPIQLRKVTYRHASAPERIAINNVTANFDAGSITTLMGPSGAGKTTLLNLLSGRLPGGTYTSADGRTQPCLEGEVLLDGNTADFAAFKKIGTLTPQDEVLMEQLTVRQTLLYTAELRSPKEWTYEQKVARVDTILVKLGLGEKADNVVGNALKVGISGGQKKRLSIGIDLLAELPVMLVDEPTTGLDASAALNVVQTLITLASDQHRTIICTIHQPPWSMVCQFDQLILLALGCLVYEGPPAGLPDFLRSGGVDLPTLENPADYVMVVLVSEGSDKWVALRKDQLDDETSPKSDERISNEDLSTLLAETYQVSEFSQFVILLRRLAYVYMTAEDQFPEVFFPSCFIALVVGTAFFNFGVNLFLSGSILMGCIAHSMIVLNGIVLNIPTERNLVLREFRNGTYSVAAYWSARATLSILVAFFHGFPPLAIWYSLVGLPGRLDSIFHVWLASTLNATIFSIIALVVGLVCRTPLASAQVCEPIGNFMILFSGQIIAKRFIKPYALPLYYGLPISYTFEIALSAVLEHKGEDGQMVLSYYQVHPSNRHFDYLVLFSMLIFWIVIGYLIAKSKITGTAPYTVRFV